MLELVTTKQFRKDYKRMKKRGYDMNLLEKVIDLLQNVSLLMTVIETMDWSGIMSVFASAI